MNRQEVMRTSKSEFLRTSSTTIVMDKTDPFANRRRMAYLSHLSVSFHFFYLTSWHCELQNFQTYLSCRQKLQSLSLINRHCISRELRSRESSRMVMRVLGRGSGWLEQFRSAVFPRPFFLHMSVPTSTCARVCVVGHQPIFHWLSADGISDLLWCFLPVRSFGVTPK